MKYTDLTEHEQWQLDREIQMEEEDWQRLKWVDDFDGTAAHDMRRWRDEFFEFVKQVRAGADLEAIRPFPNGTPANSGALRFTDLFRKFRQRIEHDASNPVEP